MFELLQDPSVWFWGICSLLVMVYYKGNRFLYSLCVTAFATGLWEIPFFLARPTIDVYFWMLWYHAVPFMIYMYFKRVKVKPLREWKLIVVWFINAIICYELFYNTPTYWGILGWYTVPYYLTYIPRGITMVMMAKALKPTLDEIPIPN